MDAALEAYLGRTSLPSLCRASHNFLKREVIGRAAQRLMRLTFGKGENKDGNTVLVAVSITDTVLNPSVAT
jgi:hypothetical protein